MAHKAAENEALRAEERQKTADIELQHQQELAALESVGIFH
jgi:hypothetical protein